MTKKQNSKILDTIHETASGLQEIGLIDMRRMRKYNALCLPDIPNYTPAKIKSIRARYKLSQTVMAAALNASPSTIRQWEIGKKTPSGPAAKLLSILDKQGLEIFTQ